MMKIALAVFVSLSSVLNLLAQQRNRKTVPLRLPRSTLSFDAKNFSNLPGEIAPTTEAATQPLARPPTTCVVGLRGIPDVPGGIETHCEHLYPRLAALRANESFIIIGRRPTIGTKDRICGQNLRVVALSAARNRYLETISNTFLGVIAARSRYRARIVHLHGIGPGLFTPLARLLGMQVVLTHHGDDFMRAKWNRLARFVLKSGERLGVGTATRVIAVSDSLAQRLRQDYPSRASRIRYIPNGADHILNSASNGTRSAIEWRQDFGLDRTDYIVSVGRLVPEKGFADLINAYAHARPTAKLVIVGGKSGSDHDLELMDQIDQLGLKGQVIMTGSLPHEGVAALMSGAQLFVLASHHEGLPIVALEASALKVPLLLSNIMPNLDLGLKPDHYFPVGDVAALAKALDESWNSFAHQDLMERFNWHSISNKTHALYAELN
jgi:glycosyltransferase involved in cell wall biosynthesis